MTPLQEQTDKNREFITAFMDGKIVESRLKSDRSFGFREWGTVCSLCIFESADFELRIAPPEPRKPREFWVSSGDLLDNPECAHRTKKEGCSVVHVWEVIEPNKKSREFWIVPQHSYPGMCISYVSANAFKSEKEAIDWRIIHNPDSNIVHVREVLD